MHFNKNVNTKSPSIVPWLNIVLQVKVDIYVKINSGHFLEMSIAYEHKEINQSKIKKYKSDRLTWFEFIKPMSHNSKTNLSTAWCVWVTRTPPYLVHLNIVLLIL